MSIEKKSLISTLKTTKKANVASTPSVDGIKAETISSKRPAGFAKRPAGMAKRPAGFAKRPSATAKRPSATAKRPSATAKRPSATAKFRPVN